MASGLKAPIALYRVTYCAETDDECERERERGRAMCQNPGMSCFFDFAQCMRSDDTRLHVDRHQRTELAHMVTTIFLRKVVHMNATDRHAELQKYGITEQEYEDAIGMSEGDAEQELGRALEIPSKQP